MQQRASCPKTLALIYQPVGVDSGYRDATFGQPIGPVFKPMPLPSSDDGRAAEST